MKKQSYLVFPILGLLALILVGCKTLTGPPTSFEQRYYDIKTNTIEMVQWFTNSVTVTNYQNVLGNTSANPLRLKISGNS